LVVEVYSGEGEGEATATCWRDEMGVYQWQVRKPIPGTWQRTWQKWEMLGNYFKTEDAFVKDMGSGLAL
jgi:hypothetical protein